MNKIIILIAILCLTSPRLAFAQQTLEEINADLQAKKDALEPFDQKKVKIDVESLGLDDVDKKKEEKPAVESTIEPVKSKEPEVKIVEKKPVVEEKKPAEQPAIPTIPALSDVLSKAQEVIQKSKELIKDSKQTAPQDLPKTSVSDIKKPAEQYINSQKKKNLKKRLEAEKQRKESARQKISNEKKQKEKLKKLKELRAKYLIKASENEEQNLADVDEDLNDDEKILPRKKNLSPFLSEELPAMPILNRYRTAENLHNPIILTPKEHVEISFRAISIGSVSYFNESFKNVENPNAVNDMGDTLLTCSLLLKRYPIIASILSKEADPNMPNKLGYTPLGIAIELQDLRSVELLVNNKADIHYTDAFGRTYLMHAARLGFLPVVDLLIGRGVDVNAMDNDGFTALSIAYRHKKELVVQYLLKNGAKTWIEKPYKPEDQSLIKELENRWK